MSQVEKFGLLSCLLVLTYSPGIRTVRSDGTVLRPMNAFMLWAKEKRVEMMKQGLQVAEVSQVFPLY